MGLFYPADEVRPSSKTHGLLRLPAGAYALVTTCDATVNPPGTKVNPSLALLSLESGSTVFAVVPVTVIVHSFDRVKYCPGRVNVERLVNKRIGRSRQKLRTICVQTRPDVQGLKADDFYRRSWVTFTPDLNQTFKVREITNAYLHT